MNYARPRNEFRDKLDLGSQKGTWQTCAHSCRYAGKIDIFTQQLRLLLRPRACSLQVSFFFACYCHRVSDSDMHEVAPRRPASFWVWPEAFGEVQIGSPKRVVRETFHESSSPAEPFYEASSQNWPFETTSCSTAPSRPECFLPRSTGFVNQSNQPDNPHPPSLPNSTDRPNVTRAWPQVPKLQMC